MQGIEVNILNGGLVPGAVGSVLPRSAFGLAHAHPVGSPVSGAGKTVALHKGLQQENGMAILDLPIATEAPANPTQNMAG